jgi:hypothetical protein
MSPYPHEITLVDKSRGWQLPSTMDKNAGRSSGLSKFEFFFLLPLEIRNMIYETFIEDSMIQYRPPLYGITSWQTPSFNYAHKFDLHIRGNKVIFRNMQFQNIYPLFTANRRIHNEVCDLLYSRIHHIRITGDFLLGLAPTQPILDMMERRPWLRHYVKTICIDLSLCGIHAGCNGCSIEEEAIANHPILSDRLQIVQEQDSFARLLPNITKERNCSSLFVSVGNSGLACLRQLAIRIRRMIVPKKSVPSGHNSLPTLAKVLQCYTRLEKIDMETVHKQLISLSPSPQEIARAFEPLPNTVEVNMLLKKWQLWHWANLSRRNGLNSRNLEFWHEYGDQVDLGYADRKGASMRSYGLVRYRVSDALKAP